MTFFIAWNPKVDIYQNVQTAYIQTIKVNGDHIQTTLDPTDFCWMDNLHFTDNVLKWRHVSKLYIYLFIFVELIVYILMYPLVFNRYYKDELLVQNVFPRIAEL